jgi:hypothetical protein
MPALTRLLLHAGVLAANRDAQPVDPVGDHRGCRGEVGGAGGSCVANLAAEEGRLEREMEEGTQFTCFTGTTVQILTLKLLLEVEREMAMGDATDAKMFALKKRLAVARAELLRLQRKSKAARAEQVSG